MSGWRIVTKLIAASPMKVEQVAAEMGMTPHSVFELIEAARDHGLIERCDGRGPGWWRATRLGLDFATGRVVTEYRRPGGLFFVATWLSSLPQDIRIPQQPQQPQEQDHAHH